VNQSWLDELREFISLRRRLRRRPFEAVPASPARPFGFREDDLK
jgi:hypothetical protein